MGNLCPFLPCDLAYFTFTFRNFNQPPYNLESGILSVSAKENTFPKLKKKKSYKILACEN